MFNYDQLVEEAFLNVVRKILEHVGVHGLPGDHHFYITYRTDCPDVVLPDYLLDDHDEEITIVLQHQFWDLQIYKEYFEVTVSFNGAHERLRVPFRALISFYDPSEKFGLQFSPDLPEPANMSQLEEEQVPETAPAKGSVKKKSGEKSKGKKSEQPVANNVVLLDMFRKK